MLRHLSRNTLKSAWGRADGTKQEEHEPSVTNHLNLVPAADLTARQWSSI